MDAGNEDYHEVFYFCDRMIKCVCALVKYWPTNIEMQAALGMRHEWLSRCLSLPEHHTVMGVAIESIRARRQTRYHIPTLLLLQQLAVVPTGSRL